MWIVLLGAPGTSKIKIAEFLKTEGFEFDTWRVPVYDESSAFERELRILLERVKKQFEIQRVMETRDIVTVRSTWDSVEVFARVLFEKTELSHRQFTILKDLMNLWTEILKPPHAFLYIKPEDKMASMDRMLMTDDHNIELFDAIVSAYEKFVQRLATPVVEVYHKTVIDQVIDQVKFSLSTLQTTKLSGQTIWTKSLYK